MTARFPDLPVGTRLDILVDVCDRQVPVLVFTDNVVWEAYFEKVCGGVITAVAKPVGDEGDRRKLTWNLAHITDLAPKPEDYEQGEEDDELQQLARRLAAEAIEYRTLPLAERILRERGQS